ncbi:MAG TPA: amino acid adenylation domain-containing protein [Opitutaceae bacterium]|nr:amino acid adenylation domain-containing protein [Opitutaceae bacterium]
MKLGDFSLQEEGESVDALRARIEAFNRTATDYPRDSTVPAQFAARAAATPDAIAVIEGDGARRHTYAEVERQANRIARFLAERGLPREGFVGVMVDGAFDLVTALLGILQAGGAYLPLDPELPAARTQFMLRDARARFLIGGRKHIRALNRLQWDCADLAVLLCPDSRDVHGESEGIGEFMREEVWDYVGKEIFDDISGGGWRSSFTGEWLSREVMDEYGDNARKKLAPRVTRGSRVLEIGCASGLTMFRLAPLVGYYHGTDLSAEILRWSEDERRKRGLENIRLEHLPAHEVGRVTERGFDVVIINSVLQCFSGLNYLRGVLRQAIGLMGDDGIIFLGNVWDQDLKAQFERELLEFERTNLGKGYRTKTDRSEDLFVARAFLEDLRTEWPEIAEIEYSRMLGRAESELSRFGYDAILRIRKKAPPSRGGSRTKWQYDARALEALEPAALPGRGGPTALAYAIYTSGTTGTPKGVLVEHRAILRLVLNTNYVRLGPADRVLMTGALSFDASTFEIWGALLNGGALCRPPERAVLDAAAMKRLIADNGITTLWLTSSLCNQLADTDLTLFTGLRTLLAGGEKLSAPHINRIRAAHPALTVVNGYGPTENTTFTCCHVIERNYPQDIPIGRPIANTTVQILDAKLAPVPPGVAGEIYTGGDGLARGYLNDEALTRAKFGPHPFQAGERLYRTGDLGRWRDDGVVEYLGRKDQQVKIRGFRIEPAEIEARLAQHEGVKAAAVLARDLGEGMLTLVAYFSGAPGLTADILRAHLERQLPEYMVPAHFVRLDAFPLTPNGKIDRRALPAPVHGGADGRVHVPPASETERTLLALWEEVLGRKGGLGVTDNFFASGGHSLKVTKLVAGIRQALGVELPLATVFKATTIREQARAVLDAARFGVEGIDEPMITLNDGAGPPVFAFPPGTGDALGYLQVAAELRPYAVHGFNFIEAETRIADYATLVQRMDPAGPHVLFGYSAGGNLAYHVAAELERRGARVAGVVMVDSGRVLRPIALPAGEVERVTEAFLGHESIRAHVATPVLREKAARLIARYFDHLARTLDRHTIAADIVGLVADADGEHRDAAGELFVSRRAWAEATRGTYREIVGAGAHNFMLSPPHLTPNAERLREAFNTLRPPG